MHTCLQQIIFKKLTTALTFICRKDGHFIIYFQYWECKAISKTTMLDILIFLWLWSTVRKNAEESYKLSNTKEANKPRKGLLFPESLASPSFIHWRHNYLVKRDHKHIYSCTIPTEESYMLLTRRRPWWRKPLNIWSSDMSSLEQHYFIFTSCG